MFNIQIERFKRLPQRPEETWQGGLIPMPKVIPGNDIELVGAVWFAVETPGGHTKSIRRASEVGPEFALEALLDFALEDDGGGYRPGRIEVVDAELADCLIRALAGTQIKIAHVPTLDVLDEMRSILREGLDQMMGEILGDMPAPTAVPPALRGSGVRIDHLRAFADAASAFYGAALWDQLTDEDLIRIEHPKPMTGTAYITVLGAGGQTYGLGFFPSERFYKDMRNTGDPAEFLTEQKADIWSISFDERDSVCDADVFVWDGQDLPLAGPDRYPVALCYKKDGSIVRPSAKRLAYFEGVLRALAQTTDEQIDAGRWCVDVNTFNGPKRYTLSIPSLIKGPPILEKIQQMFHGPPPDRRSMEKSIAMMHRYLHAQQVEDAEQAQRLVGEKLTGKTPEEIEMMIDEPKTPEQEAQDLCYDAFGESGRKQLQMAREALQINPNCADAYVILAERTGDADKAIKLYESGVSAGREALGAAYFEQCRGEFWHLLETRPHMRALEGLARSKAEAGRLDEAAEHYRELLDLNPNDNQGVRYLLAPLYIRLDRCADAEALMAQYDEDSTMWLYNRALASFASQGKSGRARKRLERALHANPHVPEAMLRIGIGVAEHPGSYSSGDESEALAYAHEALDTWESIDGALNWLTGAGAKQTAQHAGSHRYKKRKRRRR